MDGMDGMMCGFWWEKEAGDEDRNEYQRIKSELIDKKL